MVALPHRDRTALAFVLLVWVGMAAWAFVYVWTYGPPFPYGDEGHLWGLLPPYGELSWSSLWEPKNEHRVPLPRLLHYLPYAATGDLRAPLVLEVAILASAALAWIVAARRIRGRSSVLDSLFPLLFLHVGNWENLLSGFQISLMLPTALAAAILAAIAISAAPPRPGRARLLGACLVALPLCGGVGLVQAPVLGGWMALAGFTGIRSAESEERRGGRILLACVAVAAALIVALLISHARPRWYTYTDDPRAVLQLAAAVLTLSYGPGGAAAWPTSGLFLASVLGATAVLLAGRWSSGSAERLRRLGLLASLVATACVALSIGVSRAVSGSGLAFVPRYVALAIPLACAAFAAWTAYAEPRWRAVFCGGLAVLAWVVLPSNARTGLAAGRTVRDRVERFEAIVASGASVDELLRSYTELFPFHFPSGSRAILKALAARRDPPFAAATAPSPEAFDYPSFNRLPLSVESDRPTTIRWIAGHGALLAHEGTRVRFERRPSDRRVSGVLGVPNELAKSSGLADVRALVEVTTASGEARRLLELPLPERREAFHVEPLPADAVEIVLRTERTARSAPVDDGWTYWSEILIE